MCVEELKNIVVSLALNCLSGPWGNHSPNHILYELSSLRRELKLRRKSFRVIAKHFKLRCEEKMSSGNVVPDVLRTEDDASKIAKFLRSGMKLVARGHKVTVGEGPADYVKNAKGGIANDAGALVFALSDLDTWYSILMSSLIAFGRSP